VERKTVAKKKLPIEYVLSNCTYSICRIVMLHLPIYKELYMRSPWYRLYWCDLSRNDFGFTDKFCDAPFQVICAERFVRVKNGRTLKGRVIYGKCSPAKLESCAVKR
jgi:hypothetical protein